MQTENRGKDTILHPTSDKLVTSPTEKVAANIVTPPAVANIRSRSSELWLELQRCPADDGVTREAYRISMAARPAKSREYDWLLAITSAVQELEMV